MCVTTDNTGEDENSIATFGTRNNARLFHVQEVGGSFSKKAWLLRNRRILYNKHMFPYHLE